MNRGVAKIIISNIDVLTNSIHEEIAKGISVEEKIQLNKSINHLFQAQRLLK